MNGAAHLSHEWEIRAKQPSMSNSSTQNLSEYITAAFVGWNYAVGNQERRSARVVGDDAKGCIASWRCAGMGSREFARALDEGHKQIRIEIADFTLEHSGEPFKACARVDGWFWQGQDRA